MAGRIACGSRLPQRGGISSAYYNLQQWRAGRIPAPRVEKYEVLDADEAQQMRETMEKRKERIAERYGKTLDERDAFQKSFRLRTEKYMRPFTLDVHITSKYVHAAVMHRTQHKVVAAASTNAKDMRALLPSRCDETACRIIGELLADRAKEADCYAVCYIPRKLERLEGKIGAVVEAVANSGISIYHAGKGIVLTTKACYY